IRQWNEFSNWSILKTNRGFSSGNGFNSFQAILKRFVCPRASPYRTAGAAGSPPAQASYISSTQNDSGLSGCTLTDTQLFRNDGESHHRQYWNNAPVGIGPSTLESALPFSILPL